MKNLKSYIRPIRKLIPLKIRHLISRMGRYFGSEPLDIYPSIQASLITLKNRGFSPANCIDIGAYKGEWTDIFKSIFPDAKVLMIEAQKNKKEGLNDLAKKYGDSVSFESALLASQANEKVIFYEMESGSSILPELTNFPRNSVEMRTQTLDTIVNKHPDFAVLDFLKLDTQGFEIEILKGGEKTLKNTKALLLEVSIIPYNAGGPLIGDVFEFLEKRGFKLFDFCSQARRSDGVLFQTDLLFLNSTSGLIPEPEVKLDQN